ncbi:hypothetical protein ENUP19_0260G0004 [Entamoeba nuttalli]|uniref:LIM zinc finger domain containing protein n=2 Tax=Entamoeba nuttalli TaxID=412467 RepID=K2HB12_ENTNP|nr:LIM zinc finger domain containing protein [Entamoeba nuttalli P19]EKE39864.1 LIM zinc finger domain containing protein [Entamoeba nuttalli P19]|eukprot:XP_008857804.1 LIM zinc finger domain containing protein [Entamoeba nuttalli P19]
MSVINACTITKPNFCPLCGSSWNEGCYCQNPQCGCLWAPCENHPNNPVFYQTPLETPRSGNNTPPHIIVPEQSISPRPAFLSLPRPTKLAPKPSFIPPKPQSNAPRFKVRSSRESPRLEQPKSELGTPREGIKSPRVIGKEKRRLSGGSVDLKSETSLEETDRITETKRRSSSLNSDCDVEVDEFGDMLCSRCGRPVYENGIKANQCVFHAECFTCERCGLRFNERRKPLYYHKKCICSSCYLKTCPKCDLCLKPITGAYVRTDKKKFHKECFICCNCHNEITTKYFVTNKGFTCLNCIEKK